MRARNLAPATVRTHSTGARQFLDWLAANAPRSRRRSRSAARTARRSSSSSWRGGPATPHEPLLRLPRRGRRVVPLADVPVPVLSDEELRRLFKTCDGKTYADRRDTAIMRLSTTPACAAPNLHTSRSPTSTSRTDRCRHGQGPTPRACPFGMKTHCARPPPAGPRPAPVRRRSSAVARRARRGTAHARRCRADDPPPSRACRPRGRPRARVPAHCGPCVACTGRARRGAAADRRRGREPRLGDASRSPSKDAVSSGTAADTDWSSRASRARRSAPPSVDGSRGGARSSVLAATVAVEKVEPTEEPTHARPAAQRRGSRRHPRPRQRPRPARRRHRPRVGRGASVPDVADRHGRHEGWVPAGRLLRPTAAESTSARPPPRRSGRRSAPVGRPDVARGRFLPTTPD